MKQYLKTKYFKNHGFLVATLFFIGGNVSASTLSVGPGKQFNLPCEALAQAKDNDVVEIDGASEYSGDTCAFGASNLVIRGVNGRPKISAGGKYAWGKGIWVPFGNNTTIENVEMSGAAVPDQNGAAIRLDGNHLTVRNSYFHHNENGILTNNDGVSNVVIENSEFGFNGFGTGYTHNIYIGHINSLTFKGNFSHDANVGHNLKSRAQINTIIYNRFSSTTGQPSYEIDLPNAGTAYVIGNVIHQPAAHQNPALLSFGVEGVTNTKQDLYVINNTFINDDSSRGTFIFVDGNVATPVLMQNNIFAGTGTVITQTNAIDLSNYRTVSPAFVNRMNFDLHLALGSPAIGAGTLPGKSANGFSLLPTLQYKHVANTEPRPTAAKIDIGAYQSAGVIEVIPAPVPVPPIVSPAPEPQPPVISPAPKKVKHIKTSKRFRARHAPRE